MESQFLGWPIRILVFVLTEVLHFLLLSAEKYEIRCWGVAERRNVHMNLCVNLPAGSKVGRAWCTCTQPACLSHKQTIYSSVEGEHCFLCGLFCNAVNVELQDDWRVMSYKGSGRNWSLPILEFFWKVMKTLG
jgi:hypothetical protein